MKETNIRMPSDVNLDIGKELHLGENINMAVETGLDLRITKWMP